MKRIVSLVAISLTFAAVDAAGKPQNRQQTASCRAEADRKGLKGPVRKGHMRECMKNAKTKGIPAIPVPVPTRGTNPVRPAD